MSVAGHAKIIGTRLQPIMSLEEYQRAIRDGIDLIEIDHPLRVLRAMELLKVRKSWLANHSEPVCREIFGSSTVNDVPSSSSSEPSPGRRSR
jgi:hypothetical protein